MFIEAFLLALALVLALWLRPWRMLLGGGRLHLLGPTCAVLVLLPWVWALPALHPMPLPLRWSGACLVLLMLGWPLAVPVLTLAALIAGLIGSLAPAQMLDLAVWQGLLPATLALGVGWVARRKLPRNPFVYIFCRGFFGTLLCAFATALLARLFEAPAAHLDTALSSVALWLIAWGDAVVTGMMVAIFVAFRPDWLATWSDRHYLHRP